MHKFLRNIIKSQEQLITYQLVLFMPASMYLRLLHYLEVLFESGFYPPFVYDIPHQILNLANIIISIGNVPPFVLSARR